MRCAPSDGSRNYASSATFPCAGKTACDSRSTRFLLTGVAWLIADAPASRGGLYYFCLWMVPLGTSFAFFMILRQIVQHGNADRERFTNTRIFLVNP